MGPTNILGPLCPSSFWQINQDKNMPGTKSFSCQKEFEFRNSAKLILVF